ncbi:MAG TPA: PTS sugar transporter subunit IIA [Limnochordales bacterium]
MTAMRIVVLETRLQADSAEAALRHLAERMTALGLVKEGYADAVIAREQVAPTGLPTRGVGVAVPHAGPEWVLHPAIGFARLSQPVWFREMGSADQRVPVELVFMLAIKDPDSQVDVLSRLVELVQNPDLLGQLQRAGDEAPILALLSAGPGEPAGDGDRE